MKLTINRPRKDKRFPVTFTFSGTPNGFGGLNPEKTINKLYTLDKLQNTLKTIKEYDTVTNNSGYTIDNLLNMEK